MDFKKSYYLMPGASIGNKALKGGKLENKGKEPVKVDETALKVLENSVDFLVGKGALSEGRPDEEKKGPGRPSKEEKAAAELEELKKTAEEAGLEVPEGATAEEITKLLEEAKKKAGK